MPDLGPTIRLELAYADLESLAVSLDDLAATVLRRAARVGTITAAVAATAPLSPVTAAAASVALGATTAGPGGLLQLAVALRATAEAIRTAVAGMAATDQAWRFASPMLDGMADALSLPTRVWKRPGPALARSAGGTEPPPSVSPGTANPEVGPTHFSDLLTRLEQVNELPEGTIAIEAIPGTDGIRRFVVYLPGTDSWAREATRNWSSNASIRVGHVTTYQAGVEAAMQAAGVGRHDPVMLVGHSQGGMVAAEISRSGGPFSITQVVTAGSPIGDRQPPAETGLIALEQSGDPVPALDATLSPSTPDHTTLTFRDTPGWGLERHGLEHYIQGALTAERSADPEVAEALRRVEPFLAAAGPTTFSSWVISRADP